MPAPFTKTVRGVEIPTVAIGVFEVDPGETEETVADALAAGYRHVDTAAAYGNEAEVGRAIAAANAIATKPYRYGGGHGSWNDSGYDCSGSVSYVLHAAGVLSSPLDSSALMSYGAPGPGRWITIYANSGHAFMTINGRRFDTGYGGEGNRWASGSRPTSGFVVRHPPGL